MAAALWAAYAVWEYYIAIGVLCDKDCNIRVDLVFFFPILLIATLFARMSYVEPSRKLTIIGLFLGAAGVVLVAMGLSLFGYNDLPLNFHPAAVRASTNVTPFGAVIEPA